VPFRVDVVKEGGRAVGLAVRLSDRPVKGSADAERCINRPCAYCKEIVGLDRLFHRIMSGTSGELFVHADCWKAAPRVL
jgi:hypothetical protein